MSTGYIACHLALSKDAEEQRGGDVTNGAQPDLRAHLRGCYWGNFMSAGHLEALGGREHVLAACPADVVENLSDGEHELVFVGLSGNPCDDHGQAIIELEHFLQPALPQRDDEPVACDPRGVVAQGCRAARRRTRRSPIRRVIPSASKRSSSSCASRRPAADEVAEPGERDLARRGALLDEQRLRHVVGAASRLRSPPRGGRAALRARGSARARRRRPSPPRRPPRRAARSSSSASASRARASPARRGGRASRRGARTAAAARRRPPRARTGTGTPGVERVGALDPAREDRVRSSVAPGGRERPRPRPLRSPRGRRRARAGARRRARARESSQRRRRARGAPCRSASRWRGGAGSSTSPAADRRLASAARRGRRARRRPGSRAGAARIARRRGRRGPGSRRVPW